MRSHFGVFGRNLLVAAVVCAGLALGSAARAADETIDLTIDFAKILKLDKPAETIVIGNPSIADASISDEQTLVLTGKTAGTTNLIAMDKDGAEILNAKLQVASDIRQLTTIFYGKSRQTFSCAPVCEQVISVGDDPSTFNAATDQIQTRQQFATGQ
jgi:Flp pilus assembly secretin CpaC